MQLTEWLSRTMLIERFIGVLTYFCIVLYVFRTIKYKNEKKAKKALNIAFVLLVLISFFCVPAKSADLSRIREMTQNWDNLPFDIFWNRYIISSSTPVGYSLYYVSAKIGIIGILPAFCAFIYYLNSFHIIRVLIDSKDYSGRSIAYAFLFFMSAGSLYEVISGVRCFMAFSIVMRFVFDELFLDKSIFKHLIFYIIAALLHPAAIVVIIIWLIYYIVFSKKKNTLNTIFNVLVALLFIAIGIRFGTSFIDEMIRKGAAFISDRESYSFFWEYIIGLLQLFVGVYFLITRKRNMKHIDSKTKDFAKFTAILFALVIILYFEYNIFHRYLTAASFLLIPVITETLTIYEKEGWNHKCYVVIQLLSYFILLIACARGNLSGFKYFLLT